LKIKTNQNKLFYERFLFTWYLTEFEKCRVALATVPLQMWGHTVQAYFYSRTNVLHRSWTAGHIYVSGSNVLATWRCFALFVVSLSLTCAESTESRRLAVTTFHRRYSPTRQIYDYPLMLAEIRADGPLTGEVLRSITERLSDMFGSCAIAAGGCVVRRQATCRIVSTDLLVQLLSHCVRLCWRIFSSFSSSALRLDLCCRSAWQTAEASAAKSAFY